MLGHCGIQLSQPFMMQLAASESFSLSRHVKVQLSPPLHMGKASFSQLLKTGLSQGCLAMSLHNLQVAPHTR